MSIFSPKGNGLSSRTRISIALLVSVGLHSMLLVISKNKSQHEVKKIQEIFLDIQSEEIPVLVPVNTPSPQEEQLPTPKENSAAPKSEKVEEISESAEISEKSQVDTSERLPLAALNPANGIEKKGPSEIQTLSDAGELDNPNFKPYGNRKPPYPEVARQMGIEGRVRLQVLVGPTGRVEKVKILETHGHPSFATSAEKTALLWRFAPPHQMGIPVRVWFEQEVEFKLRD